MLAKIPSWVTSGTPTRIAVAAIQRSASWSFCPRPVAVLDAPRAKGGVGLDQVLAGRDDFGSGDRLVEPVESLLSPPRRAWPIAEVGDGDERYSPC